MVVFVFKFQVINTFENLETLLDCCIVSSHIPYITSGNLIKVYDNKITFDGGHRCKKGTRAESIIFQVP